MADRVLLVLFQPHRVADLSSEPPPRFHLAMAVCAGDGLNGAFDWVVAQSDLHLLEEVIELTQKECTLGAGAREINGSGDMLRLEPDYERSL
jgi:hypothetical protein